MNQNNESEIDYEHEILDLIRDNPSGLTVTDIANLKGYSRPTVSKYLSMLEVKNEIFNRKIGAYTLYFSETTSYFPIKTARSYYKALLKGLKARFPGNMELIKEIGRNIANDVTFMFSNDVFKALKELKDNPYPKIHLEIFKNYYPCYDVFQPKVEIEIIQMNDFGKKAIYRFRNSQFLEDSEDYIYHMYITCGITEAVYSHVLKRKVISNVEKVHIDENKENSFFDVSIEIK